MDAVGVGVALSTADDSDGLGDGSVEEIMALLNECVGRQSYMFIM